MCADLGYDNCFMDLIYILEKFEDFYFFDNQNVDLLHEQAMDIVLKTSSNARRVAQVPCLMVSCLSISREKQNDRLA